MQLPVLSDGKVWKVKVNTNCEYVDGRDYTEYTELLGVNTIRVPSRTTIILAAEPFMEVSAAEVEDDIDIQNTEDSQSVELEQNTQRTEVAQNIENVQNTENEQNIQNTEVAQNTENEQNTEVAQNAENVLYTEGVQGKETDKELIESALERQLENILKEMPDNR